MEIPCTTTTAIPPPLRSWSRTPQNRCSFDEIPAYWKRHDVITFLADVGMYNALLYPFLDALEKEQVKQFKSEYFKKRFAVSRSIIRHILTHIPDMEKIPDIVLNKDKNGRIRVKNRPDVFISLSYSGSCFAVTMGKIKIGTDIEVVRPLKLRKIRSSPLFNDAKCWNEKERIRHLLHMWTRVEAYAKLHDMTPYSLLARSSLPPDASFVSYCIDRHSILSLASDNGLKKDALFWIDPDSGLASFRPGKRSLFTTTD